MLNPKPLVTVVIPLHNYGRFVTETIRSIQMQSMNNFEAFIINDASTDDSEDVAREAIKDDKRFHVLNVNFRNLSATRNYGISQGSAPYVCCIDSDDKLGHPDFFEVLISELEKDRTIGIAYTSLTLMDENSILGHVPTWPPDTFDADGQYNHINQLPTCNVFLREAWRRAGGYRPFYHMVEDAELWTTIFDIGFSAVHIKVPWFHYRLHNKSASQVHRTGEIPEPDWLEWHPWALTGERPLAAAGKPPRGSWPVRFYNEQDVSIIIPVGAGHEAVLRDALHSVEGQSHRFWECIVVNDSGHDLGLENGFPWAKEIDAFPFDLNTPKPAQGAGRARNMGAKASHAPFLVFLDADDMLKPQFLEATLEAYRQNGRYVYTDWWSHEKQTNWQLHETPDYSFEAVFKKPSLHPITCLIPRQWFERVGGFDETMPAFEDVDLFMKLLTHGYCGVRVKKPLLIYNLNSGNRRKKGETYYKETFLSLLKQRYGAYMEGTKMCDCVAPPKGLQPTAPTLENVADYKETYGDMIYAKLVGKFAPEAPMTYRGPATRVFYGSRKKGDQFYIWEADLLNSDEFEKVENYTTEPQVTVIPPEPPLTIELDPSNGEPLPPFDASVERVSESYKDMLKTLTPKEVTALRQSEWEGLQTPITVDDVPEVAPKVAPVVTPPPQRVTPSKPKGKPGRKGHAR
jgi:glycosyltransferase involved in cell wall biosynthesis